MQRYGLSESQEQQEKKLLLKKYPDVLTSLTNQRASRLKCEGRILRRDTERIRRIKRFRKQPNSRLKQFESAFFGAMENNTSLFTCPICRGFLKGPITVECGHTYCDACLEFHVLQNNHRQCVVCTAEIGPISNKCVNVLVQDLLDKWRERNRFNNATDYIMPNPVEILGIEPRYHLRSGYSGLQLNNEIENSITQCLTGKTDYSCTRHRKDRRLSDISNNFYRDANFQDTLDHVFKEVEEIKDEALKSIWNCITANDFECILCSRLLLDPVTTACGHTFCRGCLTRVLDHELSCPLCMGTLNHSDYCRIPTTILQEAIQLLIPQDYNERMSISLKESLSLEKGNDIPVFVCTNAFPGVACPLYVHEPRFRLLTRRCLNSRLKRFAMTGKDANSNKYLSYGTILELKDALSLQDGRYILTTVGIRRFKVISKQEEDGYDTAKVQYIQDAPVSAEKLQELVGMHQKVHNKASKWIRSFKPRVLAEVERLIGQMPKIEKNWPSLPDGPAWMWWLMPILPLSSQLQVGFLSTTSLEKRLRAIDKLLEHMEIKMRALERNTVSCEATDEMFDESCGVSESERAYELPLNEN